MSNLPIYFQAYQAACQPQSMLGRIQAAKVAYETATGKAPTKLFLSLDFATELLIEVLPGARFVTINKNAKNEILGMTIYRVIEPAVLVVTS